MYLSFPQYINVALFKLVIMFAYYAATSQLSQVQDGLLIGTLTYWAIIDLLLIGFIASSTHLPFVVVGLSSLIIYDHPRQAPWYDWSISYICSLLFE